ncbi:hypothetical protein [Methanolobus sp. ZRKC5]|uniref:hypothetical protein n=1 Tax=unclassified Methanolobus TaxID=2629569 RepID=UPI00313C3AB8
MDVLTNREIVSIFLSILLIIIILSIKEARISFFQVIKSFFKRIIFSYFFWYFVYLSLFIYLLYYFELWDISDLKETTIWFIFSGLPIGIFVAMNNLEHGFWKRLILKNIKLITLVEIIIIISSFSLVVEIFIAGIIGLILLMNAVSKSDELYKNVEKSLNIILCILGFLYYLILCIDQ